MYLFCWYLYLVRLTERLQLFSTSHMSECLIEPMQINDKLKEAPRMSKTSKMKNIFNGNGSLDKLFQGYLRVSKGSGFLILANMPVGDHSNRWQPHIRCQYRPKETGDVIFQGDESQEHYTPPLSLSSTLMRSTRYPDTWWVQKTFEKDAKRLLRSFTISFFVVSD